jgi:hypothetical protein
MGKLALVSALMIAAVGAPSVARADDADPPPPTPFDRGKVGLGFSAGAQTLFNDQYIYVGGGMTYFVLDGVELGVSGLHEFGSGPSISQLSPSLRYIAQPLVGSWPVVPYVGTFYTHWFIGDDIPDEDAVGARVGVIFVSGHLLLGVGVAAQKIVSTCTTDCTIVYPDFSVSMSM